MRRQLLLDHYRILAFILALKQGGQHLPDATLSQLEVDVSCGGLVHAPCLALQRQSTILAVRGTASSVELVYGCAKFSCREAISVEDGHAGGVLGLHLVLFSYVSWL